MPTIKIAPSHAVRERQWQLHALLAENNVPKPYIIWIHGNALVPFLASIGRERTGERIQPDQLYRFNLETGRYRKADPLRQGGT